MDEKKKSVDTSIGSFSLQGITLEEMKQYRLYVTDQKILGIVKQEKKSESTLANVYLKTLADGKAVVFFCGKEYEFDTKSTDGELSNTVCDLVFEKEKIKEIRKKQDTITGNLITMDQSQIEIEGYGKIPLAKWVPVYKIYGTLEEKTFQDIVIGNMDVQYVVGNGKVQAVLLKEPANIKNIRVLLLNEGSPYYENIYLTSEQKMKITLGKEKREAEEPKAGRTAYTSLSQFMSITEAMESESEIRKLEESVGRISAEFGYLYPPGIPLIVPGEQITGQFIRNMRIYMEEGLYLQGLEDYTNETIRVVAQNTTKEQEI